MLSKESLEKIKKTIIDFFKKMTFNVEVEFLPETEETLSVNIKMEDPQILIGEGGQTLLEIQGLLKAMLRRKTPEIFYIDLDINEYKKKKREYLKEMARTFADEVAITKKEKELAPMPAYERRIIHLEISKREDVITESSGEGDERKVVIRPRF